MNLKKFLPLIAAAGLGLVALVIARSGIGRSNANAKPDNTVHVIVAKDNVGPGQELTADDVTEQTLTATSVPPSATAFNNANDVVGRVTVAPMVAGQPVLSSFLAPKGALSGLPALVPPGMRAITVDVNETTGVAGMIAPGSHIDVVSVINNGDHEKAIARTVCSNVLVIACGQRLSATKADGDNGGMAHTITLIAKPREAELIDLACMSANTRLVLRGNGDNAPADPRGVSFSDLMSTSGDYQASGRMMASGQPKGFWDSLAERVLASSSTTQPGSQVNSAASLASNAPATRVRNIELISGGKMSTVTFEVPNLDTDDYSEPDLGPVNQNQNFPK